jgi:hypothetical protein
LASTVVLVYLVWDHGIPGVSMIRIKVNAGEDTEESVSKLYDAVREGTQVWSMSDLRRTRNLRLVHTARNTTGTIRRVKCDEPKYVEFECKAKDAVFEAVTAGRFVNLVLRHMSAVCDIEIHRN